MRCSEVRSRCCAVGASAAGLDGSRVGRSCRWSFSRALSPSPALLAHLIRMPDAVDEYLLWAISEGGEPFQTDMPAFKDELSREQIWQIISYMRAGFPPVEANGG